MVAIYLDFGAALEEVAFHIWLCIKATVMAFPVVLICVTVIFRFRLIAVEGMDSDGPFLLRFHPGRPFRDFAVVNGGARVVHSKTSPTYKSWSVPGISGLSHRTPEQALTPGLFLGSCWPMAGPQGQIAIHLARPINVTHVSVEHLSWQVAYNIESAPKEIEVWGSVENDKQLRKIKEYEPGWWRKSQMPRLGEPLVSGAVGKKKKYLKLASFTYQIHSAVSNVQTFPVFWELRGLGIESSEVIFRILSNWGSPEYTCVYRLRVHD